MSVEINCNDAVSRIEPLLARYERRKDMLGPLLQGVQAELGYLPEDIGEHHLGEARPLPGPGLWGGFVLHPVLL